MSAVKISHDLYNTRDGARESDGVSQLLVQLYYLEDPWKRICRLEKVNQSLSDTYTMDCFTCPTAVITNE